MKQRVQSVMLRVGDVLKSWQAVDTVVLAEPLGEDVYDPYFFLSLDVYHTHPLPAQEKRAEQFTFAGAFETSQSNRKDRFLVDGVPVRLEYRDAERMRELVAGRGEFLSSLKDTGTYSFHRIANCEIVFKKTELLASLRTSLAELPDSFWHFLRSFFESRMEHHLADLGAACMRQDQLFFLMALTGFVRSACSALFAINRCFEPSARILSTEVVKLSHLPEPFLGRFESLLRCDSELTPTRKREVAELMAKSIMSLQ